MKKIILGLVLSFLAGSALAADNIPVTAGSGTPIRSTDTSVGATGAGPYVNWYTLSTSGAAGTAPTVLYSASGSSNTNAVSIQGVTSGTAVPISGNVTATQGSPPWTVNPGTAANWGVQTQGSTTAGQSGVLMQGAVTTGSPTYTTAQTAPLSLDTAGNVRVNVVAGGAGGGAVTVADGADVTLGAKADAVCGTATGTCSLIALTKYLNAAVNPNSRASSANSSPVVQPSAPSTYHLATNTAGTNASAPKGSPAVLFSCQIGNSTTSAGYFKIYNKASAPTVGTDTPVVTLLVPGPAAGGGGNNVNFGPGGLALGTGFAVATTGGLLDSDSSNGPAGITANCQYE